jgi:hypothetical protein
MDKHNLHGEQIFTLNDTLSQSECDKIILDANKKGWNLSSPSGGGHGRTGDEDPRTSKFCVLYDDDLSMKLWNIIKHHLPQNIGFLEKNIYFNSQTQGTEWSPVDIYNKMRIYKYDEGDNFPEHIDYKIKRNVFRNEKEFVQQSFFTLLIYLNEDFEGGHTGYCPNHNGIHCRFIRNVEKQHSKKDHQVNVTPKTGMAVVQDQNILHEGLAPLKGIKYILRTDIIHEREVVRDIRVTNNKNKIHNNDWERLFETSCKNYAD